jgi:hypothetical protein
MKKIIALCVSLALILSGCTITKESPSASPSPTAAPTTTVTASASPSPSAQVKHVGDYFQVKPNVHITYKGTGNEYAAFETWVDYIGNGAVQVRTDNGGTVIASVYVIEDGALKRVFWHEDVYYWYDLTAERGKNEIVLMEPIAVGTSWQGFNNKTMTITALDADVTVPYGSFKALEVTTEYEGAVEKEYYVEGLGLVKSEMTFNDTSDPVTSELENFEEGSPLNQNARFYYPDFNNGRVAYIDRTLEFYTGDKAAEKLEAALKSAPEGGALTPVLSKDAAINSIKYDLETGVVTADLSKTFITGMNAGSMLEGLILSSLADTLGSYFLTDKVTVTIDGGHYESGHFLFNAGDFLPVQPDKAVEYVKQG